MLYEVITISFGVWPIITSADPINRWRYLYGAQVNVVYVPRSWPPIWCVVAGRYGIYCSYLCRKESG